MTGMANSAQNPELDLDGWFGQGENGAAADSGDLSDDLLAGIGDLLSEVEGDQAGGEGAESRQGMDEIGDLPEIPEQPMEQGGSGAAASGDGSGESDDPVSFLDEFALGIDGGPKQAPNNNKEENIEPMLSGLAADEFNFGVKEEGYLNDMSGEKRSDIWLALLITIILITSGGAAFMSYDLKTQVSDLNHSVETLQAENAARPLAIEGRLEDTILTVQELNLQVNEISSLIKGPLTEIQNDNRTQVEAVAALVSGVEKDVTLLRADVETVRAEAARTARAADRITISAVQPLSSGGWAVNLASYSTESAANEGLRQLKRHGIDAVKYRAESDGRTWYRVRVGGFSSKEEAKRFGREAETKAGLRQTWVSRE